MMFYYRKTFSIRKTKFYKHYAVHFFLYNVFFVFFIDVVVVAEVSSYDKTVRKCLNPLPQLVSYVKPFAPSAPFLYPLKTSENL